MGVVRCNQIGLSLNKKKLRGRWSWRGLQMTPCCLGIAWRTSSVLGGLRTRSILGGSVLDGDDFDGGANELLVATMGAILLVLGVTRLVLLVRSPCYFSLSLLFFRRCNSFEGKIKPEMVLHPSNLIIQSTQKPIPFDPITVPTKHTPV